MDFHKEYETYCRLRCKERRCDECHLRVFMDAYMASQPKEGGPGPALIGAGAAAAPGGVESKIEDLIKQTKGGDILEGVQLAGRRVTIRFQGSPLLKAVGIAVSAVIRIFANFPIIAEIDLAIGDLAMRAERGRAVNLVGETGLDLISRDSKAFWNYFRPMVTDDRFAEKVFKYLSGEENDAPALVHRANQESQQPAGF